jgi:2-dehydropantoate 2-reductase
MLMASGVDVAFVGREHTAKALTGGLSLTDLDGRVTRVPRVAFSTEAASLEGRDVILCAVKSGGSEPVAEEIATLTQKPLVVSLQNGLRGADVLRARLASHTVLASVVGFNVIAPGQAAFRQTTNGPLVLEASADARLAALVLALAAAGFETEASSNIRGVQYAKLLMNVNNAVGALTDVPTARLLEDARYRRILASLMKEALGAMRAANVKPARLGRLPAAAFPLLLSLPSGVLRLLPQKMLRIDPEARSSMWDDLTKHRTTEVDDLNGEIVRLAKTAGAHAPMNRRIVDLVHEAERRNAGSPGMSADDLWRALDA